ncbi:cell division protein FtsQ/DivIB [Brevibacterium otitidis]|uniref:Cell division protein FtsQ/DivIB n=1 Tax=Brevibacterium otitidis TaxID=53364 RepID=A0ABV5X6E7_9MICO|nr:hypothetical protein GCM10023233_09710 [Brevibacterium otitidis]
MTKTESARSSETTASLTDRLAARRRSRLRRILVGVGATAAVLGLLAAAWFSPVLAITTVRAEGTEFYSAEEIEQAVLTDWEGTPLPCAFPGRVADSALAQLPKAASAQVRWTGPRSLAVTVTDRVPLIAVHEGSGWDRVDATGTTVDSSAQAPEDLAHLEISGGADRKATVTAALALLEELPEEAPEQISVIKASDPDALEIEYAAVEGTEPVTIRFGTAEDAARKFEIATALIDTGARTIDVSVPEVPVTS